MPLLILALVVEGLAKPRGSLFPLPSRSFAGAWLTCLSVVALGGAFLALSGNPIVAAVLALAVLGLLVLISNAKYRVLGEPLVFSDFALFASVFRHPQFYLSAIHLWRRLAVGAAALALLAILAATFVVEPRDHLVGAVLAMVGLLAIWVSARACLAQGIAQAPNEHADVRRHGLVATTILYWLRWRDSRDPPPHVEVQREPPRVSPELIVVVQCESFADPVQLSGDRCHALPGLEEARSRAKQWGALHVSGFGAYTMRSEYGVLFGRDEDQLGFRRYDPFLTALGEVSHALPTRLARHGWRSLFVHPHDLRFYGRDKLMPAAGFDELVGQEHFDAPAAGAGRYVCDAQVAARIVELAKDARQPTLIYAVTIENHGPWSPDDAEAASDPLSGYMHLVRNGDAMLACLIEAISAMERPACLVFFGDHRPSISGASEPFGDRHTPYVLMEFDSRGRCVPGNQLRIDVTPAGLHHAILDTILGAEAVTRRISASG